MNLRGGRERGICLLLLLGALPLELNGFYNGLLSRAPVMYWFVEILTWLVFPPVLIFWGTRSGWFSLPDLGFHTRVAGRPSLLLFAVSLVFLTWVVAEWNWFSSRWTYALFPVNHGAFGFGYREVVPAAGFGRFLALAYLAMTAGLIEEIYFRGLFRLVFRPGFAGSVKFVIVSSLFFSSIHWEGGVWSLGTSLLFGIGASVLYSLTGNLWPLILGHAWADYRSFS